LFPIRGKISNAFQKSKAAFFANEEVQGINQIILGKDYHKGFTIDEVKVSKVIFMADADVDGAHISALLERMFVMYYPQMIMAGMVYKAIPPLFSIKQGKRNKFFTEQIDIVKYIQKEFLDRYNITTMKKEPLSNRDVTSFFIKNADYIYYLSQVANTYSVEPYLLEMVLNNFVANKHKLNFEKLKKDVRATYRFMDVTKEHGTIIVSGTIDKSNLIIFSDKFINDCRTILNIIENNKELYYKINGQPQSIYQIMTLYEKTQPSSIQRYKGLGEMDDVDLAQSTLYPGSDRTLIRYTMEDAKETLEAIREYESDSKKILTLVKNVNRNDLLE
jgi:DNA gyrase/topoisomerase IV subunit B